MHSSWRPLSRSARRTAPSTLRLEALLLEDRCVPTALAVGALENVSHLPGNQSEASIAINPINPSNIVAVSNTFSGNGIEIFRTVDNGVTWTSQLVSSGQGLGSNPCCDSEVVFDAFGNLFIVYLDFVPGGRSANVLTSADGGQTLSLLGRVVTDAGLDQPTIAVGQGMGAATQSVWVSTHTSAGIQVTGANITGPGAIGAFTAPVTLPGTFSGNFGSTSVGPAGQVVVTFQNPTFGVGPSSIFTAVDPDGFGPQTFGPVTLATTTNIGGFRPVPAQPSRTIDAEGNTAFDNSNGPHRGRLYLAYVDAADTATDDTDIFVRFSDNNGATWSGPVRVNDDLTANSQFLPGLAVDPVTGNLAVGYYDARNSPTNDMTQYFVTVSTDGGATFLSSVAAAPALSNGTEAFTGDPNEFGDFYTIDFFNNVIRPVWADNSAALPNNPDGSLDIASAVVVVVPGGGGGGGGVTLSGTLVVGADVGGGPLVRIINAATGASNADFFAYDVSFMGGVRVALADVTGDGVPDIITAPGVGGGPHIKVFDGTTLRPLRSAIGNFMAYDPSFRGGVYVAAGDINGDGLADIVTAAGEGGGPHVRVFSGADGSLITQFMAYDLNFRGGARVAVGDITGDGAADIVTGAGFGGGPHVKVFSGGQGFAMVQSFFAYGLDFRGGVFVSAGDINGDGFADIITGAGTGGGAHVRVFSGASDSLLSSFFALNTQPGGSLYSGDSIYSGGVRVFARDFDGDGRPDIATVPGGGAKPNVRIFNGGGSLLGTLANVFDPSFLGGVFVG